MSQLNDHVPAHITRGDWEQLAPEYKVIDADGQSWMLRLTTDCGTTLVRTVIVDRNQLFPLGDVVTTPTVLGALTRTTEDAVGTISTLLN